MLDHFEAGCRPHLRDIDRDIRSTASRRRDEDAIVTQPFGRPANYATRAVIVGFASRGRLEDVVKLNSDGVDRANSLQRTTLKGNQMVAFGDGGITIQRRI
jgi:hypothetical protein